jgi:bifunctional DNA-binding transcriptional regulator/antitoxin component of YhaV-PrlF toxin-antitoxin module
MNAVRISKGGQVSVPADIRRRWQTDRLAMEDHGDRIILRPIPADPVRAARGSLAGTGPNSAEARRRIRGEEAAGRRRSA